MKVWKLTKKQMIVRVIILVVLLIAAYVLLCLRAAKHWKPVQVTVQTESRTASVYIDPNGTTQETRILPPEGYERVPAAEGSFLAFMRSRPLYPDGSMIYEYTGEARSGANAIAVYDMEIGTEGWQECADTAIRFWSDYFRESGQTDRLAFHLTNGFLCDWERFSKGRRVLAFGNFSMWLPLKTPSTSEQTFRDWQMTVMHYAGSLSLEDESAPITPSEARAGDILCRGGSPGHVVLFVDEAINEAGERCYLLAQGLIPAQSAHILYAGDQKENPWITQQQLGEYPVRASAYLFDEGMLRRWGEGFSNTAATE